jgi:hypothetical protein
MSDERVAVLHHAFVEDLGPTDPPSENVLGARNTRWEFFPNFGRGSSKNTWWFDRAAVFWAAPAMWSLSN